MCARVLTGDGWHPLSAPNMMPRATSTGCLQVEGRGNGIKTNVVNNVDVAKALERSPECELQPQATQHLEILCPVTFLVASFNACTAHLLCPAFSSP